MNFQNCFILLFGKYLFTFGQKVYFYREKEAKKLIKNVTARVTATVISIVHFEQHAKLNLAEPSYIKKHTFVKETL